MDEDKLLEKIDIDDYIESEDIDVDEKDVDSAFSTAYLAHEATEDVNDSDFNFGFGLEKTEQFELESIQTSNVIIKEKNKKFIKKEQNKDYEPSFNNININDINYGKDGELNIDFDNVNINEPVYEEPKKEVKKIKIKKVNSEPKVKKTKK